jgi:opacity protein-like surface antigen
MTLSQKVWLAAAAMAAVAGGAGTTSAADLGGHPRGGSIKDGGFARPPAYAAPGGPCYFRSDLGYSWSRDPDVRWPVSNGVFTGDANLNGLIDANEITYVYAGDKVSGTSLENTWFGAVGVGCGSGGPRGVRGEVMLGYHGSRDLTGTPLIYDPGPPVGSPVPGAPNPIDDPLHTSVTSYTLMLNVYKDLGTWGKVTPYVGAGIGIAYNIVEDVYFTGNPNLPNRIHGDRDIAFAWSLMTGVGIQVTERAVLDVGYRYMDFGKATSERHDNAFSVNPRVRIDDIAAHEFKVGLRYSFGSGDCCAASPMK